MTFTKFLSTFWVAALLCTSFTGSADAQQNWRHWENFDGSDYCPGGINGFQTKGAFGRSHLESCSEGTIAAGVEDDEWTRGITSTGNGSQTTCESGFISSFNCNGDYCGSLMVKCTFNSKTDPEKALYDHQWLKRGQSEEEGTPTGDSNVLYFPNEVEGDANVVLVGLKCVGENESTGYRHCDTLKFYVAKVGVPPVEKVTYSQATGHWRTFCPSGLSCNKTISETVSHGGSTTNTTQQETAESISVALSVGAKVGGDELGGSVEASTKLTTQNSSSMSTAQTITTKWGESRTQTNIFTKDYAKYDVFKVCQWVFTLPASDGNTATIETMITTCTPDAAYPAFLPGSPEDVANPCNTLRK